MCRFCCMVLDSLLFFIWKWKHHTFGKLCWPCWVDVYWHGVQIIYDFSRVFPFSQRYGYGLQHFAKACLLRLYSSLQIGMVRSPICWQTYNMGSVSKYNNMHFAILKNINIIINTTNNILWVGNQSSNCLFSLMKNAITEMCLLTWVSGHALSNDSSLILLNI